MELLTGVGIALMAFFCEYIDSTLGMGYGTTLTPLLLIMGFEPLQIVPAVLLSELFTGIGASIGHHSIGNVDLHWKNSAFKVAMTLAACSIVGTVAAVFIAITIPKYILKLYIGVLVLVIGIVILATMHRDYGFSWRKIVGLGSIAAFNKGMSGGGYGPVVMGGQLLSGVHVKNAIGITSLAEGLTCLVGLITYILTKSVADWTLAPFLLAGALLSIPFSTISVKRIPTDKLRLAIGVLTVVLGLTTIVKVV